MPNPGQPLEPCVPPLRLRASARIGVAIAAPKSRVRACRPCFLSSISVDVAEIVVIMEPESTSSAAAVDTGNAHDYAGRPGATVFLAPSHALQRLIPWTRAKLSESFFTRASVALGWLGAQATFLAGAAATLYLLVMAIRTDSMLLAAMGLLAPVATAVLQHAALCFSAQGEGRVRSTPTEISSYAIFDLLGIALALAGVLIMVAAVVDIVRDADRESVVRLVMQLGLGELVLIVGALTLNPVLINVHQNSANTLGQDGLAIVGAVFKAVLAGSRIAFGSAAAVGALGALYGCGWSLIEPEQPQAHAVFFVGVMAVGAGAMLPLYAYVVSAVYFVIVDMLDSLIRLGRRA